MSLTPANSIDKNTRWLSLDTDQLIQTSLTSEDKKKLNQFLNLGIPVLQKIKSGFVADVGDIQVCLLVHYISVPFRNEEKKTEDNSLTINPSGLQVEVCHINDAGELMARLNEQGDKAIQLLQCFSFDFPEAVWTTSQRKPLCFFTQMKEQKQELETNHFQKSSEDGDINVLGRFSNYVSFAEFNKIMKSSQKMEKISVMVPK